MSGPEVVEETLAGGLPALTVGTGTPLVWIGGSTPNHRNPSPGLERTLTVGPLLRYVGRGFAVTLVNRWPGMAPGTTFGDLAARHADALADRFDGPVGVVGVSTGGSILLQLIADRPEVVARAVVISAAYALGPYGRRVQRDLVTGLEQRGRYLAAAVGDLFLGPAVPAPVRGALRPLAALVAGRVTVDDPADTIAVLVAEDTFDVRDRLAGIPTPTLVVAGARDPFWPLEMFAETALRMPHGELLLEPRLGHAPVGNARVVERVTAFLRAAGGPPNPPEPVGE